MPVKQYEQSEEQAGTGRMKQNLVLFRNLSDGIFGKGWSGAPPPKTMASGCEGPPREAPLGASACQKRWRQ